MGGGKTRICLTKFLQYIDDPNTKIIIFRQTYKQIKGVGSLEDASKDIYPHFGGIYKVQQMRWVFPSGAMIQFGAVDSLKALEGYKGTEFTHVLIDEAADWPEEYVTFLMSRVRSAKFKGKMQIVMSCNPDNSSFLFKWVEWCLDEEGVPRKGSENHTRYMVTLGGKAYFGDSVQELYDKYGHGTVIGETFICKSYKMVHCNIYDNPVLLKNNPDYLANLLAQNRINQLRFLFGSWTARLSSTGYFKREWCEVIDRIPPEAKIVSRLRGYDLAASPEPDANSTNRSPDYTAGVLLSRDSLGTYYIEHVDRYRKRSGEVIQRMIDTAMYDGFDTVVGVPRDGGSGGVSYHQYMVRVLSEHGITTRTDKVSGHAGKLQRFLPFASLCEAGNVKVVRGEWNDTFLDELENFEPNTRTAKKDDQVDAVATAFNLIAKTMHMPSFSLPDLSRSSAMPF